MNVKKFILQNENGEQKYFNIITIVRVEKFNSLYLVYSNDDKDDELLFAKIEIDGEQLVLDNINSNDEIVELEKVLNEKVKDNG